jgi:hypothetical protein
MLNEDQNTAESSERIIEFAGRQWVVKSGCGLGPGPNCWSDSEQSVWVDGGQLHLKIREVNGTWYCAEVYTEACTQYGMHRFYVIKDDPWLDNLDKNVVAALFLYKDDQTEVDIEFVKWSVQDPDYNAQYVVQPWDKPGNREPFSMTLSGTHTTHYIDWSASAIQFKSIHGHYQEPPDAAHLIHEWLYVGDDIPTEEECLRIHINLWLYQGNPPSDGQEVEIIVKNAQLPEEMFPEKIYLPIVLNNYPPPWITIETASGGPTEEGKARGQVGPASFCNANYKVALYAKTDIWYVQPYDDWRRDVQINSDCTWQSFTHPWYQIATHLVLASYIHPRLAHQHHPARRWTLSRIRTFELQVVIPWIPSFEVTTHQIHGWRTLLVALLQDAVRRRLYANENSGESRLQRRQPKPSYENVALHCP